MKEKQHIQQEVDKTLESLDGIQRAPVNPFLFTRIRARLSKDEKNLWARVFGLVSRPVVSVAVIAIAIVINGFVFFEFRSEPVQEVQDDEQVFASEYNLSTNMIYDTTIDQQ